METPEDLPKVEKEVRQDDPQEVIKALSDRMDSMASKLLDHEKTIANLGRVMFSHQQVILKLKSMVDGPKRQIWTPRA